MTTITIKKSTPNWEKTSFSDDGDLLDYLMENFEIGKLQSMPKGDLTEKRKKTWNAVDNMSDDEFIDIR